MTIRHTLVIVLTLILIFSVVIYVVSLYVSLLPASFNSQVLLWIAALSGTVAFLSQLKNVIELVEKIVGKEKFSLRRTKLSTTFTIAPQPAEFLWNKYIVIRDLYDEPLSKLQIVQTMAGADTFLLKTIKRKSTYQPQILQRALNAYTGTRVADQIALPIEILEDESHFYEVLPYFNGPTLFQLINQNRSGIHGSLLESLAWDMMDILVPLHSANPPLVHRDISPYNVLLRLDNLRLVLLDFSSMSIATNNAIANSVVCDGFTAPEQYEGIAFTQSDIYSVGALIVYLNSGKWPPKAQDRKYRGMEFELSGRAPRTIRKVMGRMTSLDPMQRFSTAMDVLEVFHRKRSTELLNVEPIGELLLPDGSKIVMSYHDWSRGDYSGFIDTMRHSLPIRNIK